MLRQQGTGHPETTMGNGSTGHPEASPVRHARAPISTTPWPAPVMNSGTPAVPNRAALLRQSAAAIASGILVMAGVFMGGQLDSPASARELLSDLPEYHAASPLPLRLATQAPVYHESSRPGDSRTGGWVDPIGWSESVSPSNSPPSQQASEAPPAPEPEAAPPAPEPRRAEASSRGGERPASEVATSPTPDISTNDKFIEAMGEAGRESQRSTGVPASVTVAQGILESNWGKSLLATKGQNYFGIKAKSKPGPAGVINMNTWEVLGGRDVTVNDAFRAYNNMYESVEDHGLFLKENSRYAAAFDFTDNPDEFARKIHAAGYATDPGYSTKLINIMNKYDLYRFDLK